MAAMPSKPIAGGTARAKSKGMASAGAAASLATSAAGHGYANAAMPIRSGGATKRIVSAPASTDWRWASRGVRHDSTR